MLDVEFFRKLAVVLTQRVLCNTRGNAKVNSRVNTTGNAMGETRVGKCVPDIEVGKSAMACDYRCVQLSGLVGWGYLSSQEVSRRRVFSGFVIPCVSVVSDFLCFLVVSRRVSGGFRVRFIPGMCVSLSFSWKSAWVVFVCANFV